MKKILSPLLALLFVLLLLTSCKPEAVISEKPENKETVKLNQWVLDDELCSFEVIDSDADNKDGYSVRVRAENKSKKTLMFSLNRVSLNGYMCDPYWGIKVKPGEKISDSIKWDKKYFNENSIEKVTDIEFSLKVYDYNRWNIEPYIIKHYVIFPHGEGAVKPFEREINENDTIITENEKCSMIITGYRYDKNSGFTVEACLENRLKDKTLMYKMENSVIGEKSVAPYWSFEVAPGKHANVSIHWTPEQLEAGEAEDFSSLQFTLRVFEPDDPEAKDIIYQTYTANPVF